MCICVEQVRYPVGLPQVTYPVGLRLWGFLVLSVTPPLLRVLRVRRYTTLRVVLCRGGEELGAPHEVVGLPRSLVASTASPVTRSNMDTISVHVEHS